MEKLKLKGETDKTLVMKFGGTSLGDAEAISQAAGIVVQARRTWPRIVVVVSAMAGVTDLLLQTAHEAAGGDEQVIDRSVISLRKSHFTVVEALLKASIQRGQLLEDLDALIADYASLCQAVKVLGEATPRALDAVASLGERLSARLLAAVLVERGLATKIVDATQLIVADSHFQAAHPDLGATRERVQETLEPLLKQKQVLVVTGFIAANLEGVTVTLGRGGSDYSAAILGAVLPADQVWIWTDVDGVMTADPRLVPQARTIPKLSYREIAELAYFGAKVVHPKTIRPVIEAGIDLRVCNTFNPEHPGTRLVADFDTPSDGGIKAVTAIPGQRLVTIEGRGMLGVPGVAARAFGAVAATGTSVPLITQASSEQSICFAVPGEAAGEVIQSLETTFSLELARRDIDRIWATGEVVIVTAVGAGMRDTPGVAGRIFTALGERNVNVIAIAQGSSEVSISLVVDGRDAVSAVHAVHELII